MATHSSTLVWEILWTGVCHSRPPHPLKAAAAAKSLQSCPTLCDPIDGSPPGSPIPGIKNTGVGCHFLLQCMKVKSESEVAQSCLTPSDPMDCSPPGSFVHGISQARILESVAISFSRGSSQPRDGTGVSCISRLALLTTDLGSQTRAMLLLLLSRFSRVRLCATP